MSVFTHQQLSNILLNLQKWDLPIKYSYITKSWAEARSIREKEKKTCNGWENHDEILLNKTVNLYLQEIWVSKEIVIFDFWCWTWLTVKSTLEDLSKKWYIIYYHAFDISSSLINICKENLSSIKNCSFNSTVIDFETTNLVEKLYDIRTNYKNVPVLWLFLWNTVWNFTSMERVLANILEAFRFQDKLAIWIERVELENKNWFENMLNWYDAPLSLQHDFWTLKELWVSEKSWEFKLNFNYRTNSVENFFIFSKKVEVNILWENIVFKTWERIRIFKSEKINEAKFSEILLDLDFRIANLRTSEDNTYLQILVWSKKLG